MSGRVLNVAHINVHSLLAPTHLDKLRGHVLQHEYDIVGITETWLNSSVLNDSIHIDNYTIARRDRDTRGGGVAFYIHNSLNFTLLHSSLNIEQIWIQLSFHSIKYAFGCIYNPNRLHLDNFFEDFEVAICMAQSISDETYCLGDMNINMMEPSRSETIRFRTILDALNLYQIIDSPTRIVGNTSTLLDLLIVDRTEGVLHYGTRSVHIADHELIFCAIMCAKPCRVPLLKNIRDFRNFNRELFLSDLQTIPLHNIYHLPNVNDKLSFFSEKLLNVINRHAPTRVIRITKKPAPWLTNNVRLLMSLRDKAFSKFKRTKLQQYWLEYKSLRNLTTLSLRTDKHSYLQSIVDGRNSKQLWKALKNLNVKISTNNDIPNALADCNAINRFFVSSAKSVDDDELIDHYNRNEFKPNTTKFSFKPIEMSDVTQIISSIKSSATGADGFNVLLLELCSPYIYPFITHIINSCLLTGAFPDEWKKSMVIPLPKVRPPSELSHLRPISLLSVLSKMVERIMEKQLRGHLETNDILPSMQSGFRPLHSCATAMLDVTDDIVKAADRGKVTLLVLLDYSKAFDTVSHKLLIAILKFFGLAEGALRLLTNFLSGRSQQVSIGCNISESLSVSSGVPQGSILSPLLFSIYSSQMPRLIQQCSIHMYADDTQLYYSFYPRDAMEACRIINNDLHSLYKGSSKLSLEINPNKSKVVLLGNISDDLKMSMKITMGGSDLVISESARDLGLHIDANLRFKSHVTSCIQKAFMNLRLIYQHRYFLSQHLKKTLCDSLVLSHFSHCDVVYGSCLDSIDIGRIQRVQNSCLRLIYSIRKYDRISHTLATAKWLNMANRRKFHFLSLLHNIITTKNPPYLYNKITFRTDVHHLNLRRKIYLVIPRHRLSLFKRSFSYNVPLLYNKCPDEFKELSLPVFRKRVFEWLFAEQCPILH